MAGGEIQPATPEIYIGEARRSQSPGRVSAAIEKQRDSSTEIQPANTMRPSFLNHESKADANTAGDVVEAAPAQDSPDSVQKVMAEIDIEDAKPQPELPSEDAQGGVQSVEAVTLTWTRTHLICAYICMWLLYFTNAMQSSVTANLNAYITSGFESHSLIPVIAIISNVMAGASYLPVAKTLDVWGRPIGFSVMTIIAILGLILSATCHGIETYCAAQVFYLVGFSGMIYCVDVITADTSTMQDRGLAYAFTASPYVITAFAGSKASEGFYADNWRWAYGCFCLVLPVVAIPLLVNLKLNERRAQKTGLLVKKKSDRTIMQSIIYYGIEFDIVGVLLLCAGLVLFLLPFAIAESATLTWRAPHIIAMLVLGPIFVIFFALWERFVAPQPFIPYNLLLSKNIVGACLLDMTYQMSYYCWNGYFTSFLQVVYNTSIAEAGYINSTFDVVNGVWCIGVGLLIRWTQHYKWLMLIAVPLYILFSGLLIYFRKPDMSIGYLIMCEIFISIAGGVMIIGQQVALLAVAKHNEVAAVLAMFGLFGYIGSAIGNSISGAVWTNTLPHALREYLPESAKGDWEAIYEDLAVQLSYPMGSPTREGIIQAYGVVQQRMCIAGTAIMALCLIWVLLLKNVNVAKIEQVKGVLF